MKKTTKILSSIAAGLCVAGLLTATSVQAQLVQNGNFSSGLADWTPTEYASGSVTATTYGGSSVAELDGNIAYNYPGVGKYYYAELSQAISGLQASTTYTVSFEAAGTADDELFVSLDDKDLTGEYPVGNLTSGLETYSVQVTTDSPLTLNTIDFSMSTLGLPAGIAYITDVSVTPESSPVPEPSTIIAGALLLVPLGISAVRILRRSKQA